MVMRVGGNRRKTRHIMSNGVRQRGKISIRRYLQELAIGDHVVLKAEPAVHTGLYFKRYHGKAGIVTAKQGTCYLVDIDAKGQNRRVLVHPAHLKKQTN
jgi:ribosomal protein L21E